MEWRFRGLCGCGQWCAKLQECSSVWQEVRRALVCSSCWGKESVKGKKCFLWLQVHRRHCLSNKIILVIWSRAVSPECIYRVENKQKDQGYQGNGWFSEWVSQMWLFVAESKRDLRMFQDTLSRAAWRQQGRITQRVQSPCNSRFSLISPTWSAESVESVQVFTNIWGCWGSGRWGPPCEELQAQHRELCHGMGVISSCFVSKGG